MGPLSLLLSALACAIVSQTALSAKYSWPLHAGMPSREGSFGSLFFGSTLGARCLALSTSSQPGSLAQIYIDAQRPQACEAAGTQSRRHCEQTYIKRTRPQVSGPQDELLAGPCSMPGRCLVTQKKCVNAWQNLLKSSDRRSNASATKGKNYG